MQFLRRFFLRPSQLDDLRHRGNLLLAQGKKAEALEVFEELMRRFPEDPRGYDGAARALDNRSEEVLARFEEPALRLRYPRLINSVATAASVLEARGDRAMKPKAIFLFEEYVKVHEDASAYHHLGQLYRETNQDEKAMEAFRRTWDLEPRSANAYKALLNLLREHGRTAEIDAAKALWRERNPARR